MARTLPCRIPPSRRAPSRPSSRAPTISSPIRVPVSCRTSPSRSHARLRPPAGGITRRVMQRRNGGEFRVKGALRARRAGSGTGDRSDPSRGLAVDPGRVALHRVERNAQPVRDLLVAKPLGEQDQDLPLAHGQVVLAAERVEVDRARACCGPPSRTRSEQTRTPPERTRKPSASVGRRRTPLPGEREDVVGEQHRNADGESGHGRPHDAAGEPRASRLPVARAARRSTRRTPRSRARRRPRTAHPTRRGRARPP